MEKVQESLKAFKESIEKYEIDIDIPTFFSIIVFYLINIALPVITLKKHCNSPFVAYILGTIYMIPQAIVNCKEVIIYILEKTRLNEVKKDYLEFIQTNGLHLKLLCDISAFVLFSTILHYIIIYRRHSVRYYIDRTEKSCWAVVFISILPINMHNIKESRVLPLVLNYICPNKYEKMWKDLKSILVKAYEWFLSFVVKPKFDFNAFEISLDKFLILLYPASLVVAIFAVMINFIALIYSRFIRSSDCVIITDSQEDKCKKERKCKKSSCESNVEEQTDDEDNNENKGVVIKSSVGPFIGDDEATDEQEEIEGYNINRTNVVERVDNEIRSRYYNSEKKQVQSE